MLITCLSKLQFIKEAKAYTYMTKYQVIPLHLKGYPISDGIYAVNVRASKSGMKSMNTYNTNNHSVYDIKYHIIWFNKYRYHVLKEDVAE